MDTLPGDKGTPTKTERGHLTPPFGIAGEDVLGLVLRHAQERPEAPALRDDYESFTYKQLEARVKELAAGLHAAGTRPGDRVALNLGNSAAWVTTALACWWLGAIWVPLAAGDPPARAGRMVDDCGAKLIVGGRQGPT